MVVSSVMVLSCKWVFTAGGFPYPLLLTTIHMVSCFCVFGFIRLFAPRRMKLALMPDAEVRITWDTYFQNVFAISFFFAFSLGCGQLAFLHASVPFLQMLKPVNCITVSLVAFMLGVETPTPSHMIIVVTIALGVFIATYNATQFSPMGCVLQIVSSVGSGTQLAFTQKFTTGTFKVDPVSTVYYYSLPSAVLLGLATLAYERPYDFSQVVAPRAVMYNTAMALILNVLVAVLIKKTSAVTYTLVAIIKDIGLVIVSSRLFMAPVSAHSFLGYSLAIAGLLMYKAYKDNLEIFKKQGFVVGMDAVVRGMLQNGDKGGH